MQAALTTASDSDASHASTPELDSVAETSESDAQPSQISNGMAEYHRLQRRLLTATSLAVALVVPVTAWQFGPACAASLLLGGLAGLLYLRLLSRSVARLGVDSRSVGKLQLVVPVVLVLASARLHQVQLLPALVGFLLYKPALIVQALLDA